MLDADVSIDSIVSRFPTWGSASAGVADHRPPLRPAEFLGRNGVERTPPSVDETIEDVAAGNISGRELAEWLRAALA